MGDVLAGAVVKNKEMGQTGTQTCQLRRIENKVIFTSPITLISLYLVIIEQIKNGNKPKLSKFCGLVWLAIF